MPVPSDNVDSTTLEPPLVSASEGKQCRDLIPVDEVAIEIGAAAISTEAGGDGSSSQTAISTLDSAVHRVLSSRLLVTVILATCGPMGLPALWLSPRFSRSGKVLLTTLFLAFTIVFPIAMAWYWLDIAVRPVLEALESATTTR